MTWPAPGAADVALNPPTALASSSGKSASPARQAGTLPVRVAAAGQAGAAPTKVRVALADRKTARTAGIDGLLFSLRRTDGSAAAGAARVEVDYSSIRGAYGGGWSSSLRLVALPDCALTTPGKPGCLTPTPLPTQNNPAKGTLTATVPLPKANQVSTAKATPSPLLARAGGMTVLAAAAAADGSEGDFKATSLAPSGSWSAGGNSGGFGWSIPISVPPVPGDLTPKINFSYSSSSIDGRTSGTNNQSSWIGEGWEYSPGFIERKYVACENDKQGGNNTEKVGDLCWKSDNATLSLNGSSTELVWDTGKNLWKLSDDDGSRVEHLNGTAANTGNGDNDNEYWKVTKTDGTQYWFGKHRLPGWTTGKPETNSVNRVPVFGNHPGEDGYKASDFAGSFVDQAWRWNLDYVVDPHGNAMTLTYAKTGGYYAKNMKIDSPVIYTRDGILDQIDYGLRADKIFDTALPAGRVDFITSDRCDAATCVFDKEHAADWPDVPLHLRCESGKQCLQASPSFWSAKRLTKVVTYALKGTALKYVDKWELKQSYLPTGDTAAPTVNLDSISRTALADGLKDSEPLTTSFEGILLPNRVDAAEGRPPLFKRRITKVTNETGAEILVSYSAEECTPAGVATLAPDTNTKRCYPLWWTADGRKDPVKDWWHKYAVTKIIEDDTKAGSGSTSKTTSYEYVGGTNWRRDTGEFTLDKHRTWSDFQGWKTVRTLVGSTNRTKAETDYFLGMAGDTLANGSTRTVAKINGVTDRADFAGQVAQRRTYDKDGTGSKAVLRSYEVPWVSALTASQAVKGITDPDPGPDGKPVPAPVLPNKTAYLSGTAQTWQESLADDGTTWRRNTTTRVYDDTYGLLQSEGDDGWAGAVEAKCTRTQHAAPDTTNWLIAYPSQVTTSSHQPCSDPLQPNSTITAITRTSYDDQAHAVAPKAGFANATKVEQASKLQQDNSFVWETTAQSTYDQYGRLLTVKGQDGQPTTMAYTPDEGAQPTTVAVTNSKGHVTSSLLDGIRGLTQSTTDANGRTTTMTYDSLGRLTQGWAKGRDAATTDPNVTYTYNISNTAPSTVTAKKLYEDGTYGTSITHYDSLLRARQTQTDAIGTTGRVITDTFYDDHGRAYLTNAPYFNSSAVSGTMFSALANQVPAATRDTYDGRGRVLTSTLLSLNTPKWSTTHTYGADWSAGVPPNGGTATLQIDDLRGRVTERRQYKDRTPLIGAAATQYEKHTYTYDTTGQLEQIKDTTGRNTWSYTYDLRGRQTSSTDPDKGTASTTYGTDGRAQTVKDARGVTLATTYDELGRKRTLRKGTTTGTKLAEWTYDTVTGGKGLPATSIRYDGSVSYTTAVTGYDESGDPTGTKVTVPSVVGEEELAGTYTITGTNTPVSGLPATSAFSTTNTNATTALPAETVTNKYGGQDLLKIVTSSLPQTYLTDARYTPFGELAQAQLGDFSKRVFQTLSYDTTTRQLDNAITDREASGPKTLSDITYTYDDAGNITRITDKQNDATVEDDQCFTYDWARRMTEAWTSGDDCATKPVNGSGTPNLGTVDPYWTSWTFTNTGQRATEKQHKAGPITADTTRTYTYPTGTTAGHELKSVTATGGATGTDTYVFDDAGNMTTKDTAAAAAQSLTWNDEGKLASSTTSGTTTSFVYDAAGTRILKREPATTTLYLPGGQELILTKSTNTVTGNRYYTVPGGSAIRSSTDGRIRLLISDHHNTNTLSVSADTLTSYRRKSLPFGGQRGTAPGFWPGQKGFVGGDIDGTTGLTHIGAREYDPTLGQFISVDPLLSLDLPQSLNGYNYANNSPITSSDPSGLRETCGAYGNSCFEQDYNYDGSDNDDGDRATTGGNECHNDPDCKRQESLPPSDPNAKPAVMPLVLPKRKPLIQIIKDRDWRTAIKQVIEGEHCEPIDGPYCQEPKGGTFLGGPVQAAAKSAPQFLRMKNLTAIELTRPSFKYQARVTGQLYEEVWKNRGRIVQVDGGPTAKGFIIEAKWTGKNSAAWESSPYHPSNFFNESKTVDQAARLIQLDADLGGSGVRYAVSNREGAAFLNAVFREWFPTEMANGRLLVRHVPGNGM
ncbi:RHS repeat-associated core domain-containing protein [Streptomyces sp. NPDC097619]|uniref:RHS repeat domain-containing protein n=1 Tax=Streptomyces sp. NPDC097619 TaxID=3157228 RepID=UPI003325CF02